MKRGHLDELAQRRFDSRIDQNRLTKALASVDDPMADRFRVAEPFFNRRAKHALGHHGAGRR